MPSTHKHQHFFHSTKDCILLRTLVKAFKEFKRYQQWTLTGSKDFSDVPAKLLCIHAGIPMVDIGILVCSGKKGGQKNSTIKKKEERTSHNRGNIGEKNTYIGISDLHRAIVQSHPTRIFLHVVHHLEVVILTVYLFPSRR